MCLNISFLTQFQRFWWTINKINPLLANQILICKFLFQKQFKLFKIIELSLKRTFYITATLGIISGTCVACVYFAPNSTIALVLICIHLMASCVCIDIIFTITVDLFPTYLRWVTLIDTSKTRIFFPLYQLTTCFL